MTHGPVPGAGFRYRLTETGQCVMDFRYRFLQVPVAATLKLVMLRLTIIKRIIHTAYGTDTFDRNCIIAQWYKHREKVYLA